MTAALTPAEALLSLAAASTLDERLAAFAAVVRSAGAGLALRPLDLAGVTPAGRGGGAGAGLLGGPLVDVQGAPKSVTARAGAVLRRHEHATGVGPVPRDGWTEVMSW